jgi:hypothetical protein
MPQFMMVNPKSPNLKLNLLCLISDNKSQQCCGHKKYFTENVHHQHTEATENSPIDVGDDGCILRYCAKMTIHLSGYCLMSYNLFAEHH